MSTSIRTTAPLAPAGLASGDATGEPAFTPHSESLGFVEELYEAWRRDPASVAPAWRHYFADWPKDVVSPSRVSSPRPLSLAAGNGTPSAPPRDAKSALSPGDASSVRSARTLPVEVEATIREGGGSQLQERVDHLIRNYRVRGHIVAKLDPLGSVRPEPVELDPWFYGFTEADLDLPVSTLTVGGKRESEPLRKLIERLRATYCGWIGAQFMHIDSLTVRSWLQERMESTRNRLILTRDEQIRILTKLTDATMFEEFLQKKYVGAKSFSLEGAESLIPLLDLAIERAGDDGIEEIVLGMAHRGRLNVLANIMGKSPRRVFREYEDVDPHLKTGHGDVKYHLGYSSDWTTTTGKKVHLSLCFNPSHLEYVNTVALGRMRAKQDRFHDSLRRRGMVFLVHGDAAFIGEGVVQETLNLSELPAYATGGTIHIIVNNQIGFTTPAAEGRSSTYCTDVAKMLQIPIFHVNGENPEAVAQVIRLSMEFRRTFQRDVVIDMYCYRRRGHNEGDEPFFTQPVMYKAIANRMSVREGYLEHILMLGSVTADEAERIASERHEHLERELKVARSDQYDNEPQRNPNEWTGYFGGPESEADAVDTAVPRDRLADLLERQTRIPDGFKPHAKLERILEGRREMAAGKKPLDWAAAELLAFATAATEGFRVRMTGQDCERGTFSHRHAVLHDVESGEGYMPLAHLDSKQAPVEIENSPLSEAGVLGYEYGYSLDWPDGLILWEAQFGDFVNSAQVIVDQFIASAEDKWRRFSGLVMLLPHGFEGQGPEHSSARLERFLSLSAEDNIQVVQCTTPAQYFHCLRRQTLRKWRKPLVMMTPKSLLRHPAATSSLDELATGGFHKVLPDPRKTSKVSRVLLCSGKIFYEIDHARTEKKRNDVAVVRLEQFYPFPEAELREVLSKYKEGTPVVWVQEEPENMGAWSSLRVRFGESLLGRWPFQGLFRPASASPATGSAKAHKLEQDQILKDALG